MTLVAIVVGAGLLGASGLAGLLAPRGRRAGDLVAGAMMVVGGLLGAAGTAASLLGGGEADLTLAWLLPWGRIWLHLDGLSAVFLLPVFVVPALGAVYGVSYWGEPANPSARRLRVFFGLLAGSMALVVLARDGVFLLVVWEIMALSAFFAVATEDDKPDVRSAAWVYFVSTHLGTLALVALVALWRSTSGSFDLAALESLPAPLATGIFVAGVLGFGLKAGIMPLHVWLPGAHANAPSHVSAVLSGVMLKMGVYGIVRVCSLIPAVPAWWGWLLVGLGGGSAVLGIAFAIGQHDFKRLLAYSSIENVGVIFVGLGAALLGRALGDPTLTALALAGALLHVWNHALFKPLLFFSAGSVLHATGTRRMDVLGGLGRAMPRTAALACLGCVAISALPPLNGFVSEWLIYRGLLTRVATAGWGTSAGFAAAIAALALTGTLAAVAFARCLGTTFLGEPRSEAGVGAHEAPAGMLLPAGILAGLCVIIGAVPLLAVPLLRPAMRHAAGATAEQALHSGVLAPLGSIGLVALLVLAAGAGAVLLLLRWRRSAGAPRVGTWDCGYARPGASMQYTASSLGQMVTGLFSWVLAPRRRGTPIATLFPAASSFGTEVADAVLDHAVLPSLRLLSRLILRLRLLQRGKVQVYMLYILLVVLILLLLV
jgi:hydrogenase-4 component B